MSVFDAERLMWGFIRMHDSDEYHRLRAYQKRAADMMYHSGKFILADEQGLGKTATAIVAGNYACPEYKSKLVVCPKVAVGVWAQHVREWANAEPIVYAGHPGMRTKLWNEFVEGTNRLTGRTAGRWLITTYSMVDEVLRKTHPFGLAILDETHLYIKNHQTKTFKAIKAGLGAPVVFCLTGTPIVNGIDDMWTILNLVEPRIFPSYWGFVNEHLISVPGKYGGRDILGAKDPARLRTHIATVFLRRTKAEVLKELPDKIRQPLWVTMTPQQEALYNDISEDMLANLPDGSMLATPSRITQIVRLRQLLVSPALISPDLPIESGAIRMLVEAAEAEFGSNRPIAVFTPFRRGVEVVATALEEISDLVITCTGELSAKEIADRANTFQTAPKHRKAWVATIKSGVAVTLTAAKTAFFLGSEWAPIHNFQAEDRLHRLGQNDVVLAYYILHENTIDDHVLDILAGKKRESDLMLDPAKFLRPRQQAV